jgi:hypothetical protein
LKPPPPATPTPKTRRRSLAAILVATLAISGAYASAFLPGGTPGWASWLLLSGTSLIMVASMALGASRPEGLGPLRIPLVLVLLILLGGFGGALTLSPTDPLAPTLWLGLPPRAAVVVYGIGILPFLIVPLAYALTFHDLTLRPGDLERVRDEARRARGEMSPGGDRDALP